MTEQHELKNAKDEKVTPQDDANSTFERDYQRLEEKLYKERFIGSLIAIILLDIHVFRSLSGLGAVCILILELILLWVLAETLGIKTVVYVLWQAILSIGNRNDKESQDQRKAKDED